METKVAPIINKYWIEDSFPFETVAGGQRGLGLGGIGLKGYGCAGGGSRTAVGFGLFAMEMSRVELRLSRRSSGVHNGLAMGSIYIDGIGSTEAEVAAADGAF